MKNLKTIVRILHGSRLYGTSNENSDYDYKSVHLPSGKDILLQTIQPVISSSTGNDKSKNLASDIDDESFALNKLFKMLIAGDTMGIELLFAPNTIISSPEWEELVSHRALLINRECKGFVGYCRRQAAKYSVKGDRVACVRAAKNLLEQAALDYGTSAKVSVLHLLIKAFVKTHQFTSIIELELSTGAMLPHWEVCGRKMPWTVSIKEALSIMTKTFEEYGERAKQAETNQGVDWKAVSHAKRVGQQAIEILSTGFMTFPRPEAADLLAIKEGRRNFAEVGEEIDDILARVEVLAETTTLPEASDAVLMEELVLKNYLQQIL